MSTRRLQVVAAAVLLVGLAASPVLAGPPLLCHPFNIGPAPSLPWDGSHGWSDGRADYNVTSLIADTEALLGPSVPIVVRMETLRRAAIYASRDTQVAAKLFVRLMDRATNTTGSGKADPLPYFDAAYYAEALKQIGALGSMPEFKSRAPEIRAIAAGTDGYMMVKKCLMIRPGDAQLEFGAALIASDKDRAAYEEHARKARAGAKDDKLLAVNIDHVS